MLSAMAVALAGSPLAAKAAILQGQLPWMPDKLSPPKAAQLGGWQYFTGDEARAVEALVDRLIPPDPETPGGTDAGCAVFIDRQLAGPYGRADGLYISGPFHQDNKEQGQQSPLTPAEHYRKALAALDAHCRKTYGGNSFADLSANQQDEVIANLEDGKVDLGDDPGAFFKQLLKDTQQGFFADPVYGGNKDMVAWKMIGFPGARYDYRDWVDRHNERFPLPPIGIRDHPDWKE